MLKALEMKPFGGKGTVSVEQQRVIIEVAVGLSGQSVGSFQS